MKKIIALITCLVLLFSFTACNAREAVDPEVFKAAAEEVGFIVVSYDGSSISDDGYELVVMAKGDESNAEILVFDNVAQAKETYADAVYATQGENVVVEKQVSSSTYAKYYCSRGDEFTAICRIGTSVFYGKEESNDGMVRELLDKIGY